MKILFIQCNCVKNTKTLLLMVPGNGIDHRNKGIHIFLKSSWVNFFFFFAVIPLFTFMNRKGIEETFL